MYHYHYHQANLLQYLAERFLLYQSHCLTQLHQDVPDSFKDDSDFFSLDIIFFCPKGVMYTFLASQEVLRLLHVSIMSPKEDKRTFLTPSWMILTFSHWASSFWTPGAS